MPINLDAIVAQTFDIIGSTVPDTVVPIVYHQAAVAVYDAQTRSYDHGVCSTDTVAIIARPKSEEYDGEHVTHCKRYARRVHFRPFAISRLLICSPGLVIWKEATNGATFVRGATGQYNQVGSSGGPDGSANLAG